jgi:hypothetical protein
MNTSDFAQRLVDKLIAQLKEGAAPWQKPWVEGQLFGPYNPTTGNRYRGVNILALMATDYSDPRWMTYRQAQSQGWQVRGGGALDANPALDLGRGTCASRKRRAACPGQPKEAGQGPGPVGAAKSDPGRKCSPSRADSGRPEAGQSFNCIRHWL